MSRRKNNGKAMTDSLGREFPRHRREEPAEAIRVPVSLREPRLGHREIENMSKQKDHLGNEYKCLAGMCAAHGTTVKLCRSRRGRGLGVAQALDPAPMPRRAAKTVTGPDGNEYASIVKMCRATGMDRHVIYGRLRIGWTLEQAVAGTNEDTGYDSAGRPCTGPDGREYPSISAMRGACGLSVSTVNSRMLRGMSLEEAVRPSEYGSRSCADHTGKRHAGKAAMCAAWHVNAATYAGRIRRGWTVEQALTTPPEDHGGKSDPFGTPYPSTEALAKNWHVTAGLYEYYARKCPENPLAKTCASIWPGTRAGDCAILSCVEWPWFLCEGKTGKVILHALELKRLKNGN